MWGPWLQLKRAWRVVKRQRRTLQSAIVFYARSERLDKRRWIQRKASDPTWNSRRIDLVLFHSEGEPKDRAHDLREEKDIVLRRARNEVDNIHVYSPTRVREMGYEYHVKEYGDSGVVPSGPKVHMIGFSAWKPVVILNALESLDDGDVLVYRDCNVTKYPLLKYYDDFKNRILMYLDHCNFDLVVTREREHARLRDFCKTSVIRELGEDSSFAYDFPLMISNFIIIRKSKVSLELLDEWLKACECEAWINGDVHGEMDENFEWHTFEQSLLGVVVANWVRSGRHGIPANYPNLMFVNRDIGKPVIPQNYDYLRNLDR